MLKSINAILISTQNVEKLVTFYHSLGVPLEINDHGGGLHAEADFGDVHFSIQSRGATPAVERSNMSFSFHVPNLETYCFELKAKGLRFDLEPMHLPFGGYVAELRDPDGNRIVLMRWETDRAAGSST